MGQQTLIGLLLGVPGRGLRTMKHALAVLVMGLSLVHTEAGMGLAGQIIECQT
jgi:hypothetical protein